MHFAPPARGGFAGTLPTVEAGHRCRAADCHICYRRFVQVPGDGHVRGSDDRRDGPSGHALPGQVAHQGDPREQLGGSCSSGGRVGEPTGTQTKSRPDVEARMGCPVSGGSYAAQRVGGAGRSRCGSQRVPSGDGRTDFRTGPRRRAAGGRGARPIGSAVTVANMAAPGAGMTRQRPPSGRGGPLPCRRAVDATAGRRPAGWLCPRR